MPEPFVEVRAVSKRFGAFAALDKVSFQIERGELICFLGPSGCGKTTLLRCIAGLDMQSAGGIFQAGKDISWLPPSQRDFGIVFQSYALFPNLSVAENIGFGLVNAGQAARAIRARVDELVELVGLRGQETKFPGQLSGGQQQRVALARALAPSPGLLLLDEPLSALDAKVRTRLRREIRELQLRLGITTIMVTHDQEEAQSMADRIVVMHDGRVEQIGTPEQVYDDPATPFVAEFIGSMNFVNGTVLDAGRVRVGAVALIGSTEGWDVGANVSCAFRPEDVVVAPACDSVAPACDSVAAGALLATVRQQERLGAFVRLYLQLADGGGELMADVHPSAGSRERSRIGDLVALSVQPQRLRLFHGGAAA